VSRRNRISCAFKSTAGFSRVGWSRGLKAAICDRLELERLVERRQHPGDRRARFTHLTTLGEEAMAAVTRARDRVISSRLSPLSGDELSTLGRCRSTFSERALSITAASKVSAA
jgi:DNA-binding MarR family transcriptional regulator